MVSPMSPLPEPTVARVHIPSDHPAAGASTSFLMRDVLCSRNQREGCAMRTFLVALCGLCVFASSADAVCFGLGQKKFACKCLSYGFQEGTVEFAQCMLTVAEGQRQSLSNLGAAMILSSPPPPPPPRTMNCRTVQIGNTWQTQCY